MNIDNYYWAFSSAAQSISAVIAFLLAGVALAFTMMDRVADQDATLYDVIEAFKVSLHSEMAALVTITGLAILSSLFATYLNPHPGRLRDGVMIFATFMDVAAVLAAVYYVIRIVSPRRYMRAARRAYAAATTTTTTTTPPPAHTQPSSIFFHHFIALEQDIRDYVKRENLYVPNQGEPMISYSFRQMVNALYQNEKITPELRDQLLEINKFRNLLFHGHIDKVGQDVTGKLICVRQTWDREKNRYPNHESN